MTKNWTEGKKKKRRRGRSFFTWSDTFSEEKWLWEAIFHNNLFIAMTARWSFLRKKIESHSAIYKACHILIYLNLFSKLIHQSVEFNEFSFSAKRQLYKHTTSGWPEFFLTLQDHSIFENISENIETKSVTYFSSMCGLWTYKWSTKKKNQKQDSW